jgi:hypothetical protein
MVCSGWTSVLKYTNIPVVRFSQIMSPSFRQYYFESFLQLQPPEPLDENSQVFAHRALIAFGLRPTKGAL